jgi:hypothetical protein
VNGCLYADSKYKIMLEKLSDLIFFPFKVAIRNIRRDAIKSYEKLEKVMPASPFLSCFGIVSSMPMKASGISLCKADFRVMNCHG